MKRSPASLDHVPPRCALNPPQDSAAGNPRKGDGGGKPFARFPANRGLAHPHNAAQRPMKQEYSSNQEWNSTLDNSNTSWESEWPPPARSPFAKQQPPPNGGGYYKQRSTPLSYHHSSSNDWSTGESSTSSSAPSVYGGMQPQQPTSNCLSASSSYYENNNYYAGNGGGYNYDSNAGGYMQPPYRSSHQAPQYPSMRPCDPGSYNGNRNPSSCPPSQVKQPAHDYTQRNSRYGMDSSFNKIQIKKEPEEYNETEGDNFSSLFTKSLTSLYSEDPDNAYREEGKSSDPDIIVCSPPPSISNMEEPSVNYQRLAPSGGYYNSPSANYQGPRNNFSFYENRTQNSEHSSDVVELNSESERANLFRYDRPSFDDMHLYASPNDPKGLGKKRKISMPNMAAEGNLGADGRRKAPRLSSFKSDSQWTPNSFIFSDIQVKTEPEDDYPTLENEPQSSKSQSQDSSLNSNGNSNNIKSPSQQSDHHKPAPRKRSPAATCFDRFEKKSTPTNKKVSPLSAYAKVQDSVVLNIKCRRYKKRTKPVTVKEEVVYPGREEIENWKRSGAYSQTPDHAVRILMSELLERVSHVDGKNVNNGPDLMQLDQQKVRELLFQFCHRYAIDFRDFEDINAILKPRIVQDKMAKNSERASAIRKRTSNSPVQPETKESVSKIQKNEKGGRKSNKEGVKPAAKRRLRNLPGREQLPPEETLEPEETPELEVRQSRKRTKTPVVRRRYSTRSARDVSSKDSDIDIVIDSSTDGESEAGKEAEVPKKSDRLKSKQPVAEKPAKDKSSDRMLNVSNQIKKSDSNSKSKDRCKEQEKSKDSVKLTPKKKWTRSNNESHVIKRSSSIEIVDITRSDSSSLSEPNKNNEEPESSSKRTKKFSRKSRNSSAGSKDTVRTSSDKAVSDNSRKQQKNEDRKTEQDKGRSESENNFKNKNKVKISNEDSIMDNTDISECSTRRRRFRSSKINNIDYDLSTGISNRSTKLKESKTAKNKEESTSETKIDSTKMKKDNQLTDVNKKTSNSSVTKKKNYDTNPNPRKESEINKETIKFENSVEQSSKSDQEDFKNYESVKQPKAKIDSSKPKKSLCSNEENKIKNTCQPETKATNKVESLKNSMDKDKETNSATENEKLSALSKISKPIRKRALPNQANEHQQKDECYHDSTFSLKTKIKEEPTSPVTKEPKPLEFASKRGSKNAQIVVNKPDILKSVDLLSEDENMENKNKDDVQNKAAKNSQQLPHKKSTRRLSSQHSDSEPQVVLMKLPDAHINSEKSTIPLDVFERYVSKELNRFYVPEENKSKISDDNSSVGSPPELVCMKEINKEDDAKSLEQDNTSKMSLDQKDELSTPLPLIHCDEPISPDKKRPKKITVEPLPIKQLRYSADSEDSDNGLVIDLDRRTSVEDEVSTSYSSTIVSEEIKETSSNYNSEINLSEELPICDKMDEAVKSSIDDQSCSEIIQSETINLSKTTLSDEASERKSIIDNSSLKAEKTESQDAMDMRTVEKVNVDAPNILNSPKTENCEPISLDSKNSSEQLNSQQQNRVESILRSLLLERTSDGSTGPPQLSTSGASNDSKARIHEDVRQLLLNHEKQDSFLTDPEILDPQTLSDEVQSTYEDLKMALDQLTDLNANLLTDREDWVYDSKIFKDKLERLKDEIMYLQCVAYQKEKERFGMIRLKREPPEIPAIGQETDFLTPSWDKLCYLVQNLEKCIKSLENNLFPKCMEEMMNRVIKSYHIEQIRFKKQKNGESSLYLPSEPSTSSGPNDFQSHTLLSRHFLQMASIALSIAKSGVAAALMANEETSSFLSGEQLPTVESMVANATGNYGMDYIVKKCNPSVKQTILEQVLSSKEPAYSQATPSPNSDIKSSKLSSLSPQKSSKPSKLIPSSNESPFRPFSASVESKAVEENLPHKILLKALSKDTSSSQNSSQSLQPVKPEVKIPTPNSHSYPSTSYQEDFPLDFSLDKKSTTSSKSSNIPSAPSSPYGEKQKSSSKSSLKHHPNTSYSVWRNAQPVKNKPSTLLDLRTDHLKVQDAISPSKNSSLDNLSSISRCSSSPNFVLRPASATHPGFSQKPVSNPFHQQRSGSANQLTTIVNHPRLSSEPDPYQHKTERGQTDDRPVRVDHRYNIKKEENMRWPDHALACTGNLYSSDAVSRYLRSPKNHEH